MVEEVRLFFVIPVWEREHHTDSVNCICRPYLEYKDPHNGIEVWVHRRMDN